jgi:hypothetical protein
MKEDARKHANVSGRFTGCRPRVDLRARLAEIEQMVEAQADRL